MNQEFPGSDLTPAMNTPQEALGKPLPLRLSSPAAIYEDNTIYFAVL